MPSCATAHSFRHDDIAVIAQSVGAVLIATWAHDYAPKIRAMVLASPAFKVKLYVPYLCFQEARNLIAKSLPSNRCSDLLDFHRLRPARARPPGSSRRYESCSMPPRGR